MRGARLVASRRRRECLKRIEPITASSKRSGIGVAVQPCVRSPNTWQAMGVVPFQPHRFSGTCPA